MSFSPASNDFNQSRISADSIGQVPIENRRGESFRTSIGGKIYDVSILNSPALTDRSAATVERFIKSLQMSRLESSKAFASMSAGEKVSSLTLKSTGRPDETQVIVKTLNSRFKERTISFLARESDNKLTGFLLPSVLRNVKNAEIQLSELPPAPPDPSRRPHPSVPTLRKGEAIPPPPDTPPPPETKILVYSPSPFLSASKETSHIASIPYKLLLEQLPTLKKELQRGKTNFSIVSGPIGHVLDHTKLARSATNEDKKLSIPIKE